MAQRHSTIQFNPTDWLADTARMPRIVRSVLFDLYCYTWQRVEPVPASELFLILSDLPDGQGDAIIENLVAGGHLLRAPGGAVYAEKAMDEGKRALGVFEAKSRGGRGRAADPAPKKPVPPPAAAPPPEKAITTANGVQEIATAWNRVAAMRGLKQIVRMTAERQKRLNERIAEHGADALLAAITTLASNEMALSTKPTFDALLNPKTCEKLVLSACGEQGGEEDE